jgi:cbb3-type cytochrome oxidase subunit 1
MLASNLLRVSIILILVGLGLGIGMGITQDFRLMPAHAHLNLLGFVALFLAGLYYNAVPAAAATRLAKIHAWVAAIGAVLFPIGIALVLLVGPQFEPVAIIGSLIVFVGMALFAWVVFRHGFGGSEQRAGAADVR